MSKECGFLEFGWLRWKVDGDYVLVVLGVLLSSYMSARYG